MPARDAGYLSRANGAWFVVHHFLRGLSSIKKKEEALAEKRDARPFGGRDTPGTIL